jgi:hypothetical protein
MTMGATMGVDGGAMVEGNRKPSGMSELRKFALGYLIMGVCAIGVGWLATLRFDARHPQHVASIWPVVHSHYWLPLALVIMGYFCLGVVAVLIVVWLVRGDKTDGE